MRANTHTHAYTYCHPVIGNAWRAWYCMSVVCAWPGTERKKEDNKRAYPSSLSAWPELHMMHTTFQNCVIFALWSQQGKYFMKQETKHWVTKHIQPEVPVKTAQLLASEMWNLWNLVCFFSSGYLCICLSQIFSLVLWRFELCQESQYRCALDTKDYAKCNQNKEAVEAWETSSTVTVKKTLHSGCPSPCCAHLQRYSEAEFCNFYYGHPFWSERYEQWNFYLADISSSKHVERPDCPRESLPHQQ